MPPLRRATEDGRPYTGHGTPCPYDNARDGEKLKKGRV